jgi:CHAT domain-containing protein
LLPFAALRPDAAAYLVEGCAVSYVSAGRDQAAARPAGSASGAVFVGDPDFDRGPAAGAAASPTLAAPAAALPAFTRLPGSRAEVEAAARAWEAARPGEAARRLLGAEATEEALAAAVRPRLLHVATHGYFLPDLPPPTAAPGTRSFEIVPLRPAGKRGDPEAADARRRCGLALAGANRARERAARGESDGLLTALEAQDLDLGGTELVLLSACETGVGEVQVGEGVLGLRRAFQLAGAGTVVAALWKVPDAETERLMGRFLGPWLAGRAGPAAALREAQLGLLAELRQSPDLARRAAPPLLWAGFVCHGRPR